MSIQSVLKPLSNIEKIALLVLVYVVFAALVNLGYEGFKSVTEEVPTRGGTFTEGIVGRVRNLNPVLSYQSPADREITKLIFSGLVRLNPLTGNPTEDIASSIEVSEDGMLYTVHLNPERTWHDGTSVTVKDVLFTYRDILGDPMNDTPLASAFKGVEFLAVDDYTVNIQTPKQNIFFLNLLETGLLPAHKFPEGTTYSDIVMSGFNKHPLGNGPFKFSSFKSYRDHDLVVLKPVIETQLDTLRFKSYSTTELLLQSKNGLDGISEVPKSALKAFGDDWIVHNLRLPRYVVLFFDTLSSGPTSSAKVRLGLKFALNKQTLADNVGNAEVMNFPIERLNSQTVVQDKSQAASLLYGAGWGVYSKYNDSIRRNSDGKELNLTLVTTENEELISVAEEIKSQLEELGIMIDIIPMGLQDLNNDILKNRDYNMLLFGQSIGDNDDFYPFLHSSQIADPGLNISQFKDINTDVILERIREATSEEKRTELLKELQTILNNEVPAIVLYRPYYLYATKAQFGELEFPEHLKQITDRFTYLPDWFVDTKRIWNF